MISGVMTGYTIIGCLSGYVLTSVLLLKYPLILHKKKKRHFFCAHISHRGVLIHEMERFGRVRLMKFKKEILSNKDYGAAERLENTLDAYHHMNLSQVHKWNQNSKLYYHQSAIKAGTQMLEIDVHMSKDKQIVVSHDGDLKRCTGQDGFIHECKYDELPPLKNELHVPFCGSHVCRVEGERRKMPTLEEVFQDFPTTPINIDIKGDGTEIMEEACRLIKKYKREKITVWGNFKDSTTQALYKLNPEVNLLFSMKRVMWLYIWFYSGLLPFIPLKETHLEIALPDAFKLINFNLSKRQRKLLEIIGFMIKSKTLFKHLKDRGIPTYLWVINHEDGFETAFKLGAEGVMTDCPTKLTQWLNKHPQYWI